MKLVNIGFGNLISAQRLVAIVSPDSAPIKRVVQEAKERGMLIDASYGRSTKSVILMDTDHVVLSSLSPDSAPIKRVVQEAKERGMLIDASYGRKTQSVILMDTDHVILSALEAQVLMERWENQEEEK